MSTEPGYDDLNRLLTATGSAYGSQSFTYDAIGNMTNKHGQTMTYGAGSAGPHAVTSVSWTGTNFPTFCRDYASGACALSYDANGNMTARGADALTYDSENRLKEMKVRDGESGTTNYTLKPGWNVISFTHLLDNRSVSSVLSSLTFGTDYDQVSTWDSATSSWKHWVNDSDFNDFTTFEHGKTYEIYNKTGSDKSLSVTGRTRSTDITHNIVSGDNFISPAVKTATNVSTVLATLTQGTHYSDVKRFNATTQTWESYQGGAFTQFEPGKGYNIVGLTNSNFSYGKNETVTTFVYDSMGIRVKKIAGSTTTVYLGKDYDITGSISTKYLFIGDRRIAMKDSSGTKLFYHEDHISSSNVITDAAGNQAALYEYDPYGSTVSHTGSVDVKHQFTGQEKDETGLVYFVGRYMDPQLGRFITPDPTIQYPNDPQDFNRYSYARNNPVKFNDPTGFKRKWSWWGFFFGGVIGGFLGTEKTLAIAFAALTLPFTAGQSAWIIVAVAAAAGALGGGIGAAIDGGSFLRGAMNGAITGAGIGAGGAIAGAGGGSGSAGVKVSSFQAADGQMGWSFTGVESAVSDTGTSTKVTGLVVAALSSAVPQVQEKGNNNTNPQINTLDKAMTRWTDRIGVGAQSGNILSSSSSPGGGMIPPALVGEGVVVNAGPALTVDLAKANSGGLMLRGSGNGGGKRSWFDKLFGRRPSGFFNRWTWFRAGLGWKQALGKEIFRIASGGQNQTYHMHIDFEEDGIKFDLKWNK